MKTGQLSIKGMPLLAAFLICTLSSCGVKEYNVLDFGAVGDGAVKNTGAVQKAIDAASKDGGGTVVIPEGTFLSGAIYLKSNVCLHLERGAVLKASPDSADWSPLDVCPQNHPIVNDHSYGRHFILCIEQENVSITGPGIIDGNSPAFTYTPDGRPYKAKTDIPWRPGQMIWIVQSRGISVRDLSLVDSPYWNLNFYGCQDVSVEGLDISSRRMPVSWNGDGIDIDNCRAVSVKDCRICTNDDCIAIRADRRWMRSGASLSHAQCSDINVSDCDLSSLTSAVRLGVGNGVITNVSLKGLDIHNTRSAFSFTSGWSKKTRGVDISAVRISDIKVRSTVILFQIYPKLADASVSTRDVVFSDVDARVELTGQLYGHPDRPYSDILFSKVNCNTPLDTAFLEGVRTEGGSLTFISLPKELKDSLEQNYQRRKSEVKFKGI